MNDSEPFSVPLGNDGMFAIMFYNRNRYPESKLKEDFGKFGEIINLRVLENNTCFVRYQEHIEAANCLKEMANNPEYSARIPENKKRYFHERFNKSGRFSYGKDGNNSNDRNNRQSQDVQANGNKPGRFSYGNDSSDRFNRQSQDTKENENRSYERPHNRFSSNNYNLNNSNSNNTVVDEPPQLINYNEIPSRNIPSPARSNTDNPPELKPYVNVLWERELSELPAVVAIEVIIANLPPGVYQPELYELCAEGEPLEINIYFTGKQVQVYYASVYVRSLKYAHILISKLNGIFLERNQLIVELASTIWNEHMASIDVPRETV